MTQIELKSFNVAGVSHRPANIIDVLVTGQEIRLVAEPTNTYDKFAIKIEAKSSAVVAGEDRLYNEWNFIGYVPKKETWIYHIMRKAGVNLTHKLSVNHDARDTDKLLVRSFFDGNEENSF